MDLVGKTFTFGPTKRLATFMDLETYMTATDERTDIWESGVVQHDLFLRADLYVARLAVSSAIEFLPKEKMEEWKNGLDHKKDAELFRLQILVEEIADSY